MRPLASPVTEYRVFGVAQLVGGLMFGVVAVAVAEPVVAFVELALAAALFGASMYLIAYRRWVRSAVERPAAPSTPKLEPPATTRRRVVLVTTGQLVLLGAIAVMSEIPALVGGIAAGNGAALFLASRWLRNWELTHHSRLLREPRWRFSREGTHGWARGRGIMDPQDFYVVASH